MQWDSPSKILSLGWTASEALVVLTQDGTYRLYTLATGPLPPAYTQHSLGSDAADTGIVDARIWEDGMVVLLANLAFVEVKGWGKGVELEGGAGAEEGTMSRGTGRTTLMASAGIQELPECWSVIPPEVSSTRGTEVLIGTGGTVLRLDEIEVQDQVRLPSFSNSISDSILRSTADQESKTTQRSTSTAAASSPLPPPQTAASSRFSPSRPSVAPPSYGSPRPTSRARCPSPTSAAKASRGRQSRWRGAGAIRSSSHGKGRSLWWGRSARRSSGFPSPDVS